MIIDDQLVTIIDKCTAGIDISEDTLALPEIMQNAPDGNFVTSDHTLKHCRDNIRPDLFVADAVDVWQSQGRMDLYARAVEKYRELRKTLQPQFLPEEITAEMDKIVKHADDALVGKL
jgi:trimethylamine--corrinoid protein Co-methyltransferase